MKKLLLILLLIPLLYSCSTIHKCNYTLIKQGKVKDVEHLIIDKWYTNPNYKTVITFTNNTTMIFQYHVEVKKPYLKIYGCSKCKSDRKIKYSDGIDYMIYREECPHVEK